MESLWTKVGFKVCPVTLLSQPVCFCSSTSAGLLHVCRRQRRACVSVLCCLLTQTSRKRVSKLLPLSFKKVFLCHLAMCQQLKGRKKLALGAESSRKWQQLHHNWGTSALPLAHPEALLWGVSSKGRFTEGIIAELQIEFPPCNLWQSGLEDSR